MCVQIELMSCELCSQPNPGRIGERMLNIDVMITMRWLVFFRFISILPCHRHASDPS